TGLADAQAFTLPVAGEAELAGLPDFMREAMKSEARERKLDGHVVTLSRSSVEPFLQFSPRRDASLTLPPPPRPARKNLPRLRHARRQRRRDRQQGDHRRDGAAARRARPAVGIFRLRPLPAR